VSILNIDSPATPEVIEKINKTENILAVKVIKT